MFIPKRPAFNGDFFFAFGLAQRQQEWDNEFTNMPKAKAMEALKSGAKIRHNMFLEREFVYMKENTIFDENDLPLADFWKYRASGCFDTGWHVISE